jgi:hypothetical protein
MTPLLTELVKLGVLGIVTAIFVWLYVTERRWSNGLAEKLRDISRQATKVQAEAVAAMQQTHQASEARIDALQVEFRTGLDNVRREVQAALRRTK